VGDGANPKGIPNLGISLTPGQQCPMLAAPIASGPGQMGFAIGNCIRNKCAYYDTFRNQCRVVSIDQKLALMVDLLTQLVKQEVTDAKR